MGRVARSSPNASSVARGQARADDQHGVRLGSRTQHGRRRIPAEGAR